MADLSDLAFEEPQSFGPFYSRWQQEMKTLIFRK